MSTSLAVKLKVKLFKTICKHALSSGSSLRSVWISNGMAWARAGAWTCAWSVATLLGHCPAEFSSIQLSWLQLNSTQPSIRPHSPRTAARNVAPISLITACALRLWVRRQGKPLSLVFGCVQRKQTAMSCFQWPTELQNFDLAVDQATPWLPVSQPSGQNIFDSFALIIEQRVLFSFWQWWWSSRGHCMP